MRGACRPLIGRCAGLSSPPAAAAPHLCPSSLVHHSDLRLCGVIHIVVTLLRMVAGPATIGAHGRLQPRLEADGRRFDHSRRARRVRRPREGGLSHRTSRRAQPTSAGRRRDRTPDRRMDLGSRRLTPGCGRGRLGCRADHSDPAGRVTRSAPLRGRRIGRLACPSVQPAWRVRYPAGRILGVLCCFDLVWSVAVVLDGCGAGDVPGLFGRAPRVDEFVGPDDDIARLAPAGDAAVRTIVRRKRSAVECVARGRGRG